MILVGLSGPLDITVTIPVIGAKLSLRQLMQSLCTLSDMDRDFCTLVTSRPADACKFMLNKGTAWIKSKVFAFVGGLINKIKGAFQCPKDWKDALIHAIQFHFDQETGISVDIDWANVASSFFCMGAQIGIPELLTPFVNSVVSKLQAACSPSSSPAGSSATTTASPSTSGNNFYASVAASISSAVATTSSSASTSAKAVYSIPKKPAPVSTASRALVWGGVGVALIGTSWLVFRRRR